MVTYMQKQRGVTGRVIVTPTQLWKLLRTTSVMVLEWTETLCSDANGGGAGLINQNCDTDRHSDESPDLQLSIDQILVANERCRAKPGGALRWNLNYGCWRESTFFLPTVFKLRFTPTVISSRLFPVLQGDDWMSDNRLMPPDQSRPSAEETQWLFT